MKRALGVSAAVWPVLGALALGGCGFSAPVNTVPADKVNSYACDCTCDSPPRHVTAQVATSADDAEQLLATGNVQLNGQNLDMTTETGSTPQLVGIRFANLGIPQGSTIYSADLRFTASRIDTIATSLFFQCQDSDDAPPFSTTTNDLSTRPLTGTAISWSPLPWNTVGQSASPQMPPNLATIVQQVVGRAGWTPNSALVIMVSGTGHRGAASYDNNPASAPLIVIEYQEPQLTESRTVCMTPEDNPNLNGGLTVSRATLEADCQQRVDDTLEGLAGSCHYPSNCSCTVPAGEGRRFAAVCNEPCTEETLQLPGCGNFDPQSGNVTATNAPGDAPVCGALSPLSAEMFGHASSCDVSGQATFVAGGETKTPGATGVLKLSGGDCGGASCPVGIEYQLDFDNVSYGNWFSSATFSELAGLGESLPGQEAQVSGGSGLFAPGATLSSARGRRDNGDTMAVVAANDDAITVGLDLQGAAPSCTLDGSLTGTVDPETRRCENAGPYANQLCSGEGVCGSDPACSNPDQTCQCLQIASEEDLSVTLALSGEIINQPPVVHAGPDQTVECNATNEGRFTLDGSGTQDPDNNFAAFLWLQGSRTGSELGYQPRITVAQSLGTQVPYVLRAIDTFGQADEDTTLASVVDTTAPTIACNSVPTITPPLAPISFTASASDVCDPAVTATVSGYDCYSYTNKGKRIDKTSSCEVALQGGRITIRDSGGVGDHIQWTVQATDQSGNTAERSCEVLVVRP